MLLRQALFNYLHQRKAIDDATLAALLEVAASTSEELSRRLAAWDHCTAAQLAQTVRHGASTPGTRRLATSGCASRRWRPERGSRVNPVGSGERIGSCGASAPCQERSTGAVQKWRGAGATNRL